MPKIRIHGLKKEFGNHVILDNIHLDIKEGQLFGLIGMSGSGKTTLLNTMIGFLDPDEGNIYFRDKSDEYKSVSDNPLLVSKMFGFASQHVSAYPSLSVEENLDYFGSLYDIPDKLRKGRINSLLKLTHLDDSRNTLVVNLSGGMQKRLSIACALIHKPEVLLLDEPTADLDPILRAEVWDLVKRINKSGVTVVVASHFLNELEKVCDRIAILHDAKIKAVGSPMQLKNSYSKNYVLKLKTRQKRYKMILSQIRKYKGIKLSKSKLARDHLVLMSARPEELLHSIIHVLEDNGETLVDVEVNRPSLLEVFESLMKEERV